MARCLSFCQMKLETTGSLIAYVPGRVLDVGELINIFSMWLLGIKDFTPKYASSTTTKCAQQCVQKQQCTQQCLQDHAGRTAVVVLVLRRFCF